MSGRKRTAAWVAGTLAALVVAFLVLLPIGAARVLEDQLRYRGATQVTVQDMDINLFTGTVDFYGVVARNDSGRLQVDTLQVDASLWPLFSSRLEVLSLNLVGGHLDLIQGSDGVWQLGSLRLEPSAELAEPISSETGSPWGVGARSVNVQDFTLTLQSDQLTREFELQRLSVQRAFSWQPKESLTLAFSLHSGEAVLDVTARATPFDEILEVSGKVELDNLLVHNIQNPTLAAALEKLAGTVNTKLDFKLRLEPGISLDLEMGGEFGLQGAVLAEQGAQLEADNVEWQGTTTVHIDLSNSAASPEFEVNGKLELAGLRAVDAGDDFELLSLGGINLQGLNVTQEHAAIDELTLSDLEVHVQRLAHGSLRLPGDLAATSTAPDEATPLSAADGNQTTAAPYSAQVGRLILAGNNRILVRDEAVQPVFTAELTIEELLLEEIDTAGTGPLSISLVAASSDNDRLQVAGSLAPFAQPLGADLKVSLEGFDLSRLSPYLPGYNVERGRLALESTHKVVDGQLDLQNNVVIDKLKIAAKTEDEDALVAAGAAMPLDVMLGLLRDGDDRIALQIPITGSLDSFEVGLDHVIRTATQAALQKAAISYVQTALQPLGTILFAVNLAGKAARPRFEPVEFSAGASVPVAEQAEYTNKLAGLLEERPALRLTFCGVATKADQIALTPQPEPTPGELAQAAGPTPSPGPSPAVVPIPVVSEEVLLALAKTRANVVKERLVARGIDPEQLYDCRASFESSGDGAPRVEVML
jgi:hypothetical protein